jgi:hypothetical protein
MGDEDANFDCDLGTFPEGTAEALFKERLTSVRAALPDGWTEKDFDDHVSKSSKVFSPAGVRDIIMSLSLDKTRNGSQNLHFYINSSDAK